MAAETVSTIIMAVTIALMLILMTLPVVIAVYVYRDAEQRGMKPTVWMVVAAFVPLCLGLVVYLIVRMKHPK